MAHQLSNIIELKKNTMTDNQDEKPESCHENRSRLTNNFKATSLFRERKKAANLAAAHRAHITTTHDITAEFGKAYFVEYLFTNTFAIDQTFEIQTPLSDLRLVTDVREWKILKTMSGVKGGSLEENMVSLKHDGCGNQIWLRGGESVSVPFAYQSWKVDEGKSNNILTTSFINMETKRISAILDVRVQHSQAVSSTQDFHFHCAENEYFRKTIEASRFNIMSMAKYIRCSDSNAVCSFDENETDGHCKLKIKYRCGPASGGFNTVVISFYNDPYHLNLVEIWRLSLTVCHRLDITTSLGLRKTGVILMQNESPAGNIGRTVKVYPSSKAITFDSDSQTLVGNSVNEINFSIKSRAVGLSCYLVNIVDAVRHDIVSRWIVKNQCTLPPVTKEFNITLPTDESVKKRISFTNPYSDPRMFALQSTNDQRLICKENILALKARQKEYIHMLFPSLTKAQLNAAEMQSPVFLLIIDESNHIEECLRVNLKYQ